MKLKLIAWLVCASAALVSLAAEKPIYLMVAPHDLYDSLSWYVNERAKTHPEIEFAIVDTKTEIYEVADYDYRRSGSSRCRNAAESIHKYLRQYYRNHPALKYVVLGGTWYDAVNFRGMNPVYFRNDDTEVTLDNAIPGIFCPFLSSLGGNYPTDMFYGCLNEKGAYPWDADGNGSYLDEEECREKQVDVIPSVAVARLSFVPRPEFKHASGRMLNQHEMITNYLHKLNRAEALDFSGRAKYGAEGSWVIGSQPNNSGDMDRQEFEFYDFAPNMGDPRSSKTHGDEEAMSRRDLKNIAARHPVLQCKTLNDSAKTARGMTTASVSEDFFNSDMDYAWVYSHGWAMGGSYFSASAFSSHPGLLKFLNACIPCDTGMIDYYEKANGKTYLHMCLGSSGLMNPTGGFLASINNTRYGMEGQSASNGLKTYVDKHFAHNHETAGEAWLNAILDQHRDHFGHAMWMVQRNYAIAIFHGDPLVRIADDEDATISDRRWTADQAVRKATISSSTLEVDQSVAMMSAVLTSEGDFSLTSEHEFRVMDTLASPAGRALAINAPGGVGRGIEFAEADALNRLTLNTPAYFYLGGLANAKELALVGEGAVVEADNLKNVELLTFNGANHSGEPNILRSRVKGALKFHPQLSLKSTAVELQAWEPFEGVESPKFALDDADLIVGQNPFWGLVGYEQTLSGAMTLANGSKLKVKCTKEAVLASLDITSTGSGNQIESVDGGVFGLKGTTTITLEPGTTFTMVAEFKDLGSGKLVFRSPNATAANPAKVDFTRSTVAGAIELGDNVVLADPEVRTLTIDDYELDASEVGSGAKFYFPNLSGESCDVGIRGDLKLGPSFFANSVTRYTFFDYSFLPEETASISSDTFAIVGDTRFWLPLTLNQLVVTGEFGCLDVLTCADVVVENGGKFRLEGTPAANIVLRDGAMLKVAFDEWEERVVCMTWNEPTTIAWEGKVVIDVSEVKPYLTDEPVTIIDGDAHAWTSTELAAFTVADEDVVLRIGEHGDLQVSAPSALEKGPYTRTISASTAAWDTAEWYGFTRKWSQSELDLTGSAEVTFAGDAFLAADTRVALKSLTFAEVDGASLSVTLDASAGELEVVDLDFTALTGVLRLQNAKIIGTIRPAPKTVLESVTDATIWLQTGDELTIEDPLDCTLAFDAASQGVVYLRDTMLKANRNELFSLEAAPMSGFEFLAVNERGEKDAAVEIYYDEASKMICSRPLGGLVATVTSGVSTFSALNWKNSADESVVVTDWSAVEEAKLVVSGRASIYLNAAPTVKLNVGGSGTLAFLKAVDAKAALPSTLVVDGVELVVSGDILPRLAAVSGSGSLTLDTGARTDFPMTTAGSPAKDLPNGITINDGSELALVFAGDMDLWNTWNWDRLKGSGKLVFASSDGRKYRVYSPQNGWSQMLSFAHYVDVMYKLNTSDVTYCFRNLEGEGKLGIQPGDTNSRATMYYEITQTKTTEWAGTGEYIRFAGNDTDSDHQFILKGGSSPDARLVYTGRCEIGQPFLDQSGNRFPSWAATWNHTFTVDETGVLELNGRWVGPLVNRGLVVLGSNAELTMADGSDSLLNGRVAGLVDLTTTKVTFGSGWTYDANQSGEIRFATDDLYAVKPSICRISAVPTGKKVVLVAVDSKGNTARRVVTAADIKNGYLNWRGPAMLPRVLFR